MSLTAIGLIGVATVVLIMLWGMPIAFAMALVGFVGFSYVVSPEAGLHIVAQDLFSMVFSPEMSVIPLFMLMGYFAFAAGIGSRLYSTAYKWMGHFPGGLAIATMGACAAFGACTGSGVGEAAMMGKVALPEMRKYGYDAGLAAGCVAAGGTLGLVIPPSIAFVIYGIMTGESISKLFIAGIFPGLLITFLSMVTIYIVIQRNPSMGPRGARASWKERLASLKWVWEVATLFALVMGGLFVGLFTPVEAGAVGAFGTFCLGLARQQFTRQGFLDALFEALLASCMVIVLLFGATVFGHFIVVTNIPLVTAAWIAGLPLPPIGIMLVLLFFLVAVGCFMETFPVMIICIPIFCPVAVALGYDLIWFGVFLTVALNIGMITPPVAINVYVIKGVAPDLSLETIFRGVTPFTIAMIIATIILVVWPQITLFLPNLMK